MFAVFGPHSPEVCSEDLSCEAIVYLGLDVVVSLIGASRWNPSEPWAKTKNTYKLSSSPPKDKPSSIISTIIPSVTPSLHLGFAMFRCLVHPPLRWYPETRGYGEVKCWRYPPAPGSTHSGRGDSTEMPLGSAWGRRVKGENSWQKKRPTCHMNHMMAIHGMR